MKQVFQTLDGGLTAIVGMLAPQVLSDYVLIRTEASIISPGPERILVEFGRIYYCSCPPGPPLPSSAVGFIPESFPYGDAACVPL